MSILGTAEVLIVPVTSGFEKTLKDEVNRSGSVAAREAEAQGVQIGGGLRKGISSETEKLSGDVEKHSTKAASTLQRGLLFGLAGVSVAAAAAGLKIGESMQGAEASIAAAAGTSIKAAGQIGSAFEGTAFKSEFSAVTMAKAFADVAGQLKETEGHALNAAEASKFMAAADDLATAKQIDLGTATKATAGIMQAFHLETKDAAHVADVLYRTSIATGQGVDTLASQLERVKGKAGEMGGSIGDLAGLLVDLTDRGITGRAALATVNTALNGLDKAATATGKSGVKFRDELKALGVTVFDQNGRFVGMRDIIDQLHGRIAGMTQQQQLQTVATVFGTGAARQMLSVIQAGPQAYDKATESVNKHGSAQQAAAVQSKSLHVEEETLKAGLIDLAAKVGGVLIPVITTFIGWITKATTFVVDHKAVLIAVAAVVTGILGPALAVFTVNKMASFVQSFKDASGHVKSFASDVESAVSKVQAAFGKQTSAAQAAATNLGTQTSTMAADTSTAAATIETDNATAGGSFTAVATDAETAATNVGVAEARTASEVAAADTAIEADNTAAGGSFAGIGSGLSGVAGPVLGAAGVVGGSIVVGNAIEKSHPNTNPNVSITAPTHGMFQTGAGVPTWMQGTPLGDIWQAVAPNLGRTPPIRPHPRGGLHGAADVSGHVAAISSKIHTAKDRMAKIASGGDLTKSQIEALWVEAGGDPSMANLMASIALAESGGNPSVVNSIGASGLWQIHPGMPGDLNPLQNAKDAVMKYRTQGLGAWTTYTNQAYKQFLGVPGSYGNARGGGGSGGGGASLPYSPSAAERAVLAAGGIGSYSAVPAAQAIGAAAAQAPISAAQQKADLNLEIAKERVATDQKIAQLKAELVGTTTTTYTTSKTGVVKAHTHHVGPDPALKARVDAEIASLKAALQIQIAQQKGALSVQTAEHKAELKRQSGDLKAGTVELNKMLTAIHGGGVKQLESALWSVHLAGLSHIEQRLDHDHSTALAQLSKELVKVHQQAMKDLVKAQAAAAQAAADKAQTALLGKESTDLTKTATDQARVIAETTAVTIDQQNAAGLTGLALAAADAQTSLDQVKLSTDNAISAAQAKVDADTAAGASALQLAQDNYALAQATANATTAVAQAQSNLDLANNAANNANNPAATGTGSGVQPQINLTFNGPTSASGVVGALMWELKTGSLPPALTPAV